MTIFDSRPEKRIARNHATTDPTYIGSDAAGGVHYWDAYSRTVIVVEGDRAETCTLGDADRPLKHWREHTAAERGWENCQIVSDPLLAGGL